MKTRNFIVIIAIIALLLGIIIHWREYELRGQIPMWQVLLWQAGIWFVWIPGFLLFKYIISKTGQSNYANWMLSIFGILWLCVHYGWFVGLSSTCSPYLDLPGSRFGVFPYFFIFWTLIDIGLVWFVIDKLKNQYSNSEAKPLLLELTRGGKTYFCDASQILYLVSDNYYSHIHTTEGIFTMRQSLKTFQEMLPEEHFLRIHRSTIINLNFVSELKRGKNHRLEVILKDGTSRRVSRNSIKEVIEYFRRRTL